MRVLETVESFRKTRASSPSPLGFVATMGYLHEGHMALVRRARQENASVAASIFVNPTQFGPTEDLAKYPRDLPRDLAMLEREGVDLVFVPSVEEMYPQGYQTYVEVEKVSKPLEGEHRPGHFKGVATVVAKLFGIVKPNRAYFGQKDAQQLRVIQQMVRDLDVDIEIVPCPTVREADGLAMSSRNTYLNPQERRAALVLWRSLRLAQEMRQKGERDAERIRQEMRRLISGEPLACIEYVSVAHPDTLQELERLDGPALVSLAVGIGKTRLIDNVTLE